MQITEAAVWGCDICVGIKFFQMEIMHLLLWVSGWCKIIGGVWQCDKIISSSFSSAFLLLGIECSGLLDRPELGTT